MPAPPPRRPLHCILPPHILEAIARNGNAAERAAALATLAEDHLLRRRRAGAAAARPRTPRPAPLAAVAPRKVRTICDADGGQALPGRVVRAEGAPPTADPAVEEAWDGLGATFDFFLEVYGRNSIDGAGLPLAATVHFGHDYDNAFWNGERMVFGDGDGRLFNRFTRSLDVIGHELTHGVTEHEAWLRYAAQAGALNESMSDVFGSLLRQRARGQDAARADWLIGAELLAAQVKGVALRSLKAPGTAYDDPVLGRDPQPAHMRGYVRTTADNGGVHINSGIPNHAFYLAAIALGGNAWDAPGRIWYETLCDSPLKPAATFRDFARLTVATAARIHGRTAKPTQAVAGAWHDVGVL